MDVNIENVEVQDVEDAGTGLMVDHPGVAEETELESPHEEGAEEEGTPAVDAGDGSVENGGDLGTGDDATDAGQPFVTGNECPYGCEFPYDQVFPDFEIETTVYATDGHYVECDTETMVYWFEQKVVGLDPETGEMIDLGYEAERFEDHYPATPTDVVLAGCIPVEGYETEIGEPLVIENTETVASVQSQTEMLAETGVDLSTPVILGAIALAVVGAWLIANTIAKQIGRKNK